MVSTSSHAYGNMLISPNLDRLLEYDERTSRRRPPNPQSQTGSNGSIEEPSFHALPVPPRTRKPPKQSQPTATPSRDKQQEVQVVEYSPPATTSNPWVNPSPTFERVLLTTPTRTSSMADQQSKRRLNRVPSVRSFSSTSSDISISSTVHFDTSTAGHTNAHYFEDRSTRVSFIELGSPTTESMPTEKPPIPTAPKPNFAKRHSSISPVPSHSVLSDSSSNLLSTADRQGLVRKSRKLAQVFGQTPQAASLTSFLDIGSSSKAKPIPTWPPPEGTQYLTANGRRRHSSPLTPDDFSFSGETGSEASGAADSTSFIDLSDEEDDGISAIISYSKRSHRDPSSPSAQSFYDSLTPEQQVEEERRKKRDKLAKLHRFLGSRVPTGLALGISDSDPSLPSPDDSMISVEDRKTWLKRRRSSSAAAFPLTVTERLKEDLDEQEKAINVRRAVKMEKVFGVAPPQTLYHTRHTPSPSLPVPMKPVPRSSSFDIHHPEPSNMNQTAYKSRYSYKKSNRPGTAESSQQLLPKDSTSVDDLDRLQRVSLVYNHYQHSLNSLNDIIDRDDRESLAELHEYLNSPSPPPSPPIDRRMSVTSSKSERRRSLPTRTSVVSLAADYNSPEVSDFQLRRRRAAKLTQFFGVDYRDLVRDVLDSIESGLEHEHRRGAINTEEAEDLLRKLRRIKTKRDGLS